MNDKTEEERRQFVVDLIDAVAKGDKATARAMLAAQPALRHEQSFFGETALHFCAVEKMFDAVKFFIEEGFDVNTRARGGGEALITELVIGGRLDMLELLLENGANPNIASEIYGSPLMSAADGNNEAAVRLLLNYGADPNFCYEEETALGCAVNNGNEKIARILLENGATPGKMASWNFDDWREMASRMGVDPGQITEVDAQE